MRSGIACISVVVIFLLSLPGCSGDPAPVVSPVIIPVQFGCYTFNLTDEWKITRSADTLLFEKDSCTIKVNQGFNLTFTLFRTLPPTRLPALTIPEMEMLNHYFPAPYYPDSLPSGFGPFRFSVSVDSLLHRYTCYSDSTGYPSEFLAVHPESGNSIHFETISGHPNADSIFELIAGSIRFVPDRSVPTLLAFSSADSTINCCDKLLQNGTENPYYAKTVIRSSDTLVEYWTSARFDNTAITGLDWSMQLNGDSIFVNVFPGLFDLEYFEESELIASPPRMTMIQCDCWTCATVYYKIRVPKSETHYKIKFPGETISVGEPVLLQ